MKLKLLLGTLLLAFSFSFTTTAQKVMAVEEETDQNTPDIKATSAVTMDLQTGEIIYSKNGDEKKYPASTTKLMTGLLLAENKQKDDKLSYTTEAKKQPADSLSINFKPQEIGSQMSADDILKSLMIFSANDAAYVIADSVSGNFEDFVSLMNKKAKEIGLLNTHFSNPNGLHDDNHYSTAYDLALLGKAAYSNEWVKKAMETKNATVVLGDGSIANLINTNKGLDKDGNIAGKTGFTTPAGRCLVSVYKRDNRYIVGAVLKSQFDAQDQMAFDDMNKIMDYSYNAPKEVLLKKGSVVQTIKSQYRPFKYFGPLKTIEIPLILNEDVSSYNNEINKKDTKISVDNTDLDAFDIANKEDLSLHLTQRLYKTDKSITADLSKWSIIKDNILLYLGTILLIAITIKLIFYVINLKNRRRRRYRPSSKIRF